MYELAYRWLGLQRYRCRDCRKVFRQPLAPGQEFAEKRRRTATSIHSETSRIVLNSWQSRVIESAFFLALLTIFYAAFNALAS